MSVKTFCFLIFLPVLISLANDVYLSFYAETRSVIAQPENALEAVQQVDVQKFRMADFGYSMNYYAPDLLENLRNSTNPETWSQYISPVMQQSGTIVFLVPALLIYSYLIFAWAFGIWPHHYARGSKARTYGKPSKGGMKYKRRG